MEYGKKPCVISANWDLVQTIHHESIEAGIYRHKDNDDNDTIIVSIVALRHEGMSALDNFEADDLAALAEVALEAKRWIEERQHRIAFEATLRKAIDKA